MLFSSCLRICRGEVYAYVLSIPAPVMKSFLVVNYLEVLAVQSDIFWI